MNDIRSPEALVIFGSTGDLAKRKLLPALYQLEAAEELNISVICVVPPEADVGYFRSFATGAICDFFGARVDDEILQRVLSRITVVAGDVGDRVVFETVARLLTNVDRPIHFLAVPPTLSTAVVAGISTTQMNRNAVIMIEKPFGHDLPSARRFNDVLHSSFQEQSVLRIDHYLGKESIDNLMIFRSANSFLEPIWNRDYISSIKITHCETRGVETRGSFYECVGAIRDVVQNHLLQLMALVAMRLPRDESRPQDEGLRVLRATRAVRIDDIVRGQYYGYTDEPGVAADSVVETYAAMKLHVDLPEWQGVPFFIRSGKGLASTAIEAVVEFRVLPDVSASANRIRFRIGRNPGVTMTVQAKHPGPGLKLRPVDIGMDLSALGNEWESYAHLLADALAGKTSRFVLAESVEESWRIVGPTLDRPDPPHPYPVGTWGPAAATQILGDDQWVVPEV